jgi:lactate dehydrogenase-like 2-hydroxyacid dehydrogenase
LNAHAGPGYKPRILLSRLWPQAVIERLKTAYSIAIDTGDRPPDRAGFIEAMHSFDALCPTVTDRIDATILAQPDARVRLIANYGAGFEHIDLDAARRAGIAVTNTPDVLTEATAELALLLILMASRRAGEGERELRRGDWSGWRPTHLNGNSVSGKLLGLIGYGRIAQALAAKAQAALGMRIAYHSRSRAAVEGPVRYVPSLDALLAEADVVSLHCPGGAATQHLIDGRRLALMKRDAILINTARGSVVDEQALASSLATGRMAAAGLDVFEREPAVFPGLLALENVVLLPHLGSATLQTRVAMGMRVADNLDAFFAGRTLPDRVA